MVLVANIKTTGRFVKEDHPGSLGQGPDNLDQLELTAAQFVGIAHGQGLKTHKPDCLFDLDMVFPPGAPAKMGFSTEQNKVIHFHP